MELKSNEVHQNGWRNGHDTRVKWNTNLFKNKELNF